MQISEDINLQAIDANHIWHPFTQQKIADQPLLVRKAKDEFIYIEDSEGNEKKLIDGISSWWVNIHGHSNPYIAEAIKKQLADHEQVIFAGFTHEPAIRLVDKLLPILPKADSSLAPHRQRSLTKAFFSDNGSTAVEVAIKMAIQYFDNHGQVNRKRIIAFKDGYHGDTVGAMSASSTEQFQAAFKKLLYPVHFVDSPAGFSVKPHKDLNAEGRKHVKEEAKMLAEDNAINQILDLINRYPDEIAAVIIEPLVQGAGGMKFHRTQFLQKLRKLTDDAGIVLIADEVFTGFGRTGSMFACSKASIVPDIICLSKAITGGFLPMGLTVTTEMIYSAFYSNDKYKTFFHGHSYTGNSLACAAALASLELFERENRQEDINYINLKMTRELKIPELENHEKIKDVRVMGAIAAIEYQADETGYFAELSPKLAREFLKRGLLLRPLGDVVYFLPPYTITNQSLDYSLSTIKDVLISLLQA